MNEEWTLVYSGGALILGRITIMHDRPYPISVVIRYVLDTVPAIRVYRFSDGQKTGKIALPDRVTEVCIYRRDIYSSLTLHGVKCE